MIHTDIEEISIAIVAWITMRELLPHLLTSQSIQRLYACVRTRIGRPVLLQRYGSVFEREADSFCIENGK